MTRSARVALALLAAGVAAFALVPWPDGVATHVYTVVAIAALVLGWTALRRSRGGPRGWRTVLGGFSVWVAGDLVWSLEHDVLGLALFPAPSDGIYLVGYVLLFLGAQDVVRSGPRRRDAGSLWDAAIVTCGLGVPAVVFVLVPAAADSELSVTGTVITAAYPLLDLLVLSVVVRLVLVTGLRTPAVTALTAALAVTLAADAAWNVLLIGDPEGSWLVLDTMWLASYVIVTAGVLHPSVRDVAAAAVPDAPATSRRLALLAVGSLLPAVTLLVAGLRGEEIPWLTIAVGGALLTVLVLVRMAGLLEQVREQAVLLAALARRDELTGAPNRRTWDHEFSRACAAAREEGSPLSVAILDLDHFKEYNDRLGHAAGDRLLREAVAVWTALLPDGCLLARFGGEEFTVLLPGHEPVQAAALLERLRRATPDAQTFSAGVAAWLPGEDPAAVLHAADVALYEAKRAGRDRVVVSGAQDADRLPERWRDVRVELHPVVEAGGGDVVAHEARLRLGGAGDTLDDARRAGVGDLVEGAFVAAALATDRPAGDLHLAVSVAALVSERFWVTVPPDLAGVVIGVAGAADDDVLPLLRRRLRTLRDRGARLAVVGVGGPGGEVDRIRHVTPDLVVLDPGLVRGIAADAGTRRVVEAVVGLAGATGARVRADGSTDDGDRRVLAGAGVALLLDDDPGRPGAGERGPRAEPPVA